MNQVTDPILTGKICPYCGKETELIDSAEVYGTSYGPMYICRDCNAYVGCYSGTTVAFGRLANAELRKAKMRAHHYLDQLWKSKKHSRYETYTWLSEQLGIPRELTHVGMSDVDQCKRIADVSLARLKQENIEFEMWPDDIV
jgi:hypothetical protein